MKRTVSLAALLVGLSLFQGHQRGIVPTVHAQVDDGHEGCSNATLNGAYGFFRTGTTAVGPLAAVGIATLDGTGAGTARQTIRKNGVTTSDLFASPTAVGSAYEVDPNCAGRLLSPDGSVAGHFVIVDGGNELFNISLSNGNSVYGVFKKIAKRQD